MATARQVHSKTVLWWWRAWRSRNPLLRRLDTLDRAVAGLLVAGVCAIALGSALVAVAATAGASSQLQKDRADLHPVVATVSAPPFSEALAAARSAGSDGALVRMAWTWRGALHDTMQVVGPEISSREKTSIWVDGSGDLSAQSLVPGDVAVTGVATGLTAALLTVAAGVAARVAHRRWTLRRSGRLREEEWRVVAER